MFPINYIEENLAAFKKAAQNKNNTIDFEKLLLLNTRRKELLQETENLRNQKNKANSEIVKAPKEKKATLIEAMKKVNLKLNELEPTLKKVNSQFREMLLEVPNLYSPDTPVGKDAQANKVIKTKGEIPKFNFTPKSHIELATDLDLVDFKRGVKVLGNRGYYLKNELATIQMVIMRQALEFLQNKGFTVLSSPALVPPQYFWGTGYFPWSKEEVYEATDGKKKLNLIGSSEVTLSAYFSDEILDYKDLPIHLTAFSPCFRTEIGSYGKDTHGFYRVHEFFKVEQLVICENSLEESEKQFNYILGNAEEFLEKLELPYQVLQLSTGDMGQLQYKKYDIEAWMPSKNSYGETHSCSSFLDAQARRLNLRFKDKKGKKHFAYTLNNTLIASPRILIPLLENHQQEDGTVKLPKFLKEELGLEKLS
jgi:seryl-tRNA synthetase